MAAPTDEDRLVDEHRLADEHSSARARERTARLSVGAAGVLVAIKLAPGPAPRSPGRVAGAAHPATALVAALLTLFGVRLGVRPADREHHYGHGKAEHLAALAESAVLGLVSAFIGFESVRRLAGDGGGEPRVTGWALPGVARGVGVDATPGGGRSAP